MDINMDMALDMNINTYTYIHIVLNMSNYPENDTQEIVTMVTGGDKK